ncbi:MAG: AAA family ATPase [Bacteroidaceae bacterium]|nr:AAA family ATPase [Bacteroidaceae bacterium]
MNRKEILDVISGVIPQTKIEGDQLKKRTIADTFHVGGLSGNRLNSGTLRSQFIICEKESDWENSDMSAKKAIHCDQRVFVQKAENDIWDVYVGKTQDSETEEPLLLKQNQSNLKDLLNQERKNLLFEIKQTFARHTETESLQIIYYGAPGTGKSHIVKIHTEGESVVRTTFHPDSDYSTFVGCYKPTTKEIEMRDVTGKVIIEHDQPVTENRIIYQFVDQAFLQAYIKAWKFYAEAEEGVAPNKQFLIIEEINRGNCAQIFGDLFQLLDRNDRGFSEYFIHPDKDMQKHISNAFKDCLIKDSHKDAINSLYPKDDDVVAKVLSGKILLLPNNLYIWATMNTCDQSLFPIDSAFKRRWDWEYEPIKYKNTNWIIDINGNKYSWVSFQREINKRIYDATSSEDKMLGDYFVNPADGIVTEKMLLNKILFYLWNDVCKDGEGDIFKTADNEDVTFSDLHSDGGADKLIAMMTYLNVDEA